MLRRLIGVMIVLCGTGWAAGADGQLTEIAGWGTVVDPDGKCTIRAQDGKLSIRVPPGVYDIWYGEKDPAQRFNAPRVVRQVRGDFVAQVKVTADWTAGAGLSGGPFPGRFSRVAGLLVWDSENQYLRHERNLFVQSGKPGIAVYWTPPLYDRNATRISEWKSGTTAIFQGRSTWLRVERSGQTITSSISHDGRTWQQTTVQQTEFPPNVQVGVLAHQASDGEFVCEFEEFKILN